MRILDCLMQGQLYFTFMAIYVWKSDLHDNFRWKSSQLKFNNICETGCGLHGKFSLWPYVNQTSLWIGIASNKNFATKFNAYVRYWILNKLLQRLLCWYLCPRQKKDNDLRLRHSSCALCRTSAYCHIRFDFHRGVRYINRLTCGRQKSKSKQFTGRASLLQITTA